MPHTSSNLPVCIDQTNTSNVSIPPAHTISPLVSTVRQENWAGRGEVNVRKFLYLKLLEIWTSVRGALVAWCRFKNTDKPVFNRYQRDLRKVTFIDRFFYA